MTPEFITGYFIEAMKTTMLLAGPILAFGLISGLMVSIFQATTQINEMTLVFIPKMVAVGAAIIIFFPWMLQIMIDFTQNLLINLPNYIR